MNNLSKAITQYKFSIYLGLLAMAVFLLITSCTTTKIQPAGPTLKYEHHEVAKRHFNDDKIEKRLREEYTRWKGTRHRLGGTSSRGVDCSGFVKAVYKDVFNIDLPRTTRTQVRHGQPVPFGKLRAGDLVFFKPPSYPSHVGIFLSESEFVHASKNKGVTVSKIDRYYWGKYYWTARRILPASKHP